LVPSASQSKVSTVTKIWEGLATERFTFLLNQIFWGRDAIFRCIFLRLVFDDGLSMGCQKRKEKGKNIKKGVGKKEKYFTACQLAAKRKFCPKKTKRKF